MNTKALGWIVALAAVGALAFVLWSPMDGGKARDAENGSVAGKASEGARPGAGKSAQAGREDAAPAPAETVPGSSVTKEDVDRLPPSSQKMKGLIEITGRGARAQYGNEVSCSFYYVTEVAYESCVRERKATPAGEIRVVETRRYDQCSDQITFGDFDVRLNLGTLPIRQVAPYVSAVTEVVGAWLGMAPGSGDALVKSGVEELYSNFDGLSAKKTLSMIFGIFGADTPSEAAGWVDSLVKPEVRRVHAEVKSAVQEISGREYVVTYYQSASGEPLRVKFERADNARLSMQEYRILREMNVFLSCNVVPAGRPKVGETWKVQVQDLPGAFESLSGGNRVSGELQAKRLPDEPDGLWKVDIGGGRVAVLNDSGMESGSFAIESGAALVTAESQQIRAFEMTGSGRLRVEEAQKRLLVLDFIKRTDGDCRVRVTLTSADAK